MLDVMSEGDSEVARGVSNDFHECFEVWSMRLKGNAGCNERV